MNIPTQPINAIDSAKAGAIIRQKREAKGLALIRLAARMKLSNGYLCDLEQGKRNWTQKLFSKALEKIAEE